jgi:hypothetical protein
MVRARVDLHVYISSTTAEERDLGKIETNQFSDVSADGGVYKTTLPANAANVQLRMGNLGAVALLAIRTESVDPTLVPSQVNIRKNSNQGEETAILPFQDGSGLGKCGIYVVTTTGITSLFASNMSATPMNVFVGAVGQ